MKRIALWIDQGDENSEFFENYAKKRKTPIP